MGFCGSTRKGRYSRIGRVARTIQARRAAGGEVQARYKTELSAEDYVSSKAWWHANPPSCPFHPAGGCTLVPHGSYGRKTPAGTRVRRFLCKASGRTVSMLPDWSIYEVSDYLGCGSYGSRVVPAFGAARRAHAAVESAINNLECRGLNRVRAHGADGFERMVGLSVLSTNFQGRRGIVDERCHAWPDRRQRQQRPAQAEQNLLDWRFGLWQLWQSSTGSG